jgi:hypothetical protein
MSSGSGKKLVLTKNSISKSNNEETSSSSSSKHYPPLPITQNRYSPLSPSYKQTLSPIPTQNLSPNSTSIVPRPNTPQKFSVLAQLQNIPKSPSIPNISKSYNPNPEYQINPNKQIIKILEPLEELKLKQGFQTLIEHLYPKGCHFYTNDYQNREYYQTILIDTKSIVIEHTFNDKVPNYIDCSKVKILNVISPEEWSIKPFSHKTLSGYSTYPVYNYYDYQEAWFKAFLLRSFNHTWFFYFADKFIGNYPRWFLKWFKYMGVIPEIFPPKVLQGYNKYKEIFAQENAPIFEYTLQFTIIFRIPWITLFTYKKQDVQDSSPPLLYRQYSVKWWKKVSEDQANEQAVFDYHKSLTQQGSISTSSRQTITDTDFINRLNACTSPEEMQMIINEIKKSPTPSEELYQDAQDPYDNITLN